MRRKDRELNIFSMSALDLFASAMGAFILVMLVLMPFYLKTTPVPPEMPQCPTPEPVPECPVCPTPDPIPDCEPTVVEVPVVRDKLLVVQMIWKKRVDMDLYVTTPDGKFWYSQRTISGAPGDLAVDDLHGHESRASEIWLSHDPTPGNYEVCFKYHTRRKDKGRADVWGVLYKPTGPINLERKTLSEGEKQCVIKFRIDNELNFRRL